MTESYNFHLLAVWLTTRLPELLIETWQQMSPLGLLYAGLLILLGIVWRYRQQQKIATSVEKSLLQANIGILIKDQAGRMIWSNQTAAQLLEISPTELKGINPEQLNKEILEISTEEGIKWLKIKATTDNTGTTYTLVDISPQIELEKELEKQKQQRLAEQNTHQQIYHRLINSLHKSQARLQYITDDTPTVLYQMRSTKKQALAFSFVSGHCYEILEIEPADLLNDINNLIQLIHPDDQENWHQTTTDAVNHNQGWKWSGRLITPSGQLKWFHVISEPQNQLTEEIIWDGLFIDISNRKQAEIDITKQKQKLAQNFQQTPLAVIEWSLAFEIIDWNPAAEQIFGYTRAEVIGQSGVDLIASDINTEQISQLWHQFINHQFSIPCTQENLTKDGRIIICEWYYTPLFNDQGQLTGVISLAQDITERKLGDEALRESEARFRAIFEQAAVGVALIAVDGQFLRTNHKFCAIVGYSQEELLELKLQQLSHPHETALCLEAMQQMLVKNIQPDSVERRYLHKNRSFVWVNITISLLREKTGEPKYFMAVIVDISRRKKAETALRESQERFQAIAEVTPIPIFINRLSDNKLLYANPAFTKALGLPPGEAYQQESIQFYQNIVEEEKVWAKFKKDGFVRAYEMQAVKMDGSYFWISLSIQPLTLDGENAFLIAFYDISARKQADALLLERSRLSTLAAEIGVALVQSSNLSEMLQRCTEVMDLCLSIGFAGIWTYNPATKLLELCSFTGEQPATTEFADTISLGFSLIGFVAQNRQIYITPEPSKFLSSHNLSLEETPQSFLAGYPLIVDNRLVGVMAILSHIPYTESARSTLSWVANAMAIAIDRAWVRQKLLSSREALLFELASQIRNSLELNTILEIAVEKIRSLLNIDRCVFVWYNLSATHDSLEIVMEAKNQSLPTLIGSYKASFVRSVLAKLMNLEILRIDDAKTESSLLLRRFCKVLGCNSLLAIPIQTRTNQTNQNNSTQSSFAIGIVGCLHYQQARSWTDSELELLTAVTAQLAIAIDQAELYAQSVNTASVAQAKAEQLADALQELKSTQAQLIQTEKMSSLGQLVAGVAHEINNPVNFIYANISHVESYTKDLLDLVQAYQEDVVSPSPRIEEKLQSLDLVFLVEDFYKILSSMKFGAERIRQIVLSLRNFSRLDEAEMKFVDLHQGIDSTLMILQSRFKLSKHPGIDVVREYGNLPEVECYAGQLNQVFLNIFTNAIDALQLEDKRGVITIKTELINSCAVIRIIDNAKGMPPEVMERIFDPFFTTKPVGKGTGLGLSICYQIIVGQHKGVLECFSEQGKGTEFYMQIPIRQR